MNAKASGLPGTRKSGSTKKNRELPKMTVRIAFKRNSRYSTGSNLTQWFSYWYQVRVYSTPELDQWIKANQLTTALTKGEQITVDLVMVKSAGRGEMFYASPHVCMAPEQRQAEFDFEVQARVMAKAQILAQELAFKAKRRIAMLIDGQNLAVACRELGLNIVRVIEALLKLHHIRLCRFYICRDADIGRRKLISEEDFRQILGMDVSGVLSVVDKPLKRREKGSNVDEMMHLDVGMVYHDYPGLEGLVLVSGDGGFARDLNASWLNEERGGPKMVEVVSAKAMLARALCLDGVRVKYLEDLTL